MRFRHQEVGGSSPWTISILNFCDQAMSGRQTSWSSRTIITTSVSRPSITAVMSPALAAVCRYAPSPGSRKSRVPTWKISAAIRKNQPPDQDIMLFQMSPMAAHGSSSILNRSQRSKRKIAAASRSSPGIVDSDW